MTSIDWLKFANYLYKVQGDPNDHRVVSHLPPPKKDLYFLHCPCCDKHYFSPVDKCRRCGYKETSK